ncbi:MAG: hypothetical protein KQ78_01722 [Candidatus Izimaplasma bacterium HR2]|nr:MAG: hypothetical protein KQ78_01722 [Candidatus Izimaplasma bacterium HR2]
MRLYKYLSISSKDDDISAFRSLKLDLVKDDTGNIDIVKRISEKYLLDDTVLLLLEKANRELKKMYRGKLKFDFCLDEQGMMSDGVDIRVECKKVKQLKEKWFKFNDELSGMQIDFEKKHIKSLQKK